MVTVLAVLHGWSTNALPDDNPSHANAKVRIQVCVPTKRVYFNDLRLDQLENHPQFTRYSPQQLELAPKTIRRVAPSDDPRVANDPRVIRSYGIDFGEVLKRSGLFSDSSGFMPVKDSTVADQPVYEKGYGYPAQEYVAMHLRLPDMESGPEGNVTYWFKLPKSISMDTFTDWFAPTSMETRQTGERERRPMWWVLTHGGELRINPVPINGPKMRVMLHKPSAQHNDPTNDSLPALTTARLKLKAATSGRQFVYEFVAKSNEAIPKCD